MTAHLRPVIGESTARDAGAVPGRECISGIDEPARKDWTVP